MISHEAPQTRCQARLNFGLNVQNLGPSLAFVDEDKADPLSRNVKVGAAWVPFVTKDFTLTLVDYSRDRRRRLGRAPLSKGAQLALWILLPVVVFVGIAVAFGAYTVWSLSR